MTLVDDARVTTLVADYVGVDAGGKLNLIGAGFVVIGLEASGGTSPFGLALIVEAPPSYVGQEFTVSVELWDETIGMPVTMAGPSGQPEALRVQQAAKFERMQLPPGSYMPVDLAMRLQINLTFSNGLPLKQHTLYKWRVEIDGQHRDAWSAYFAVPGPPPGPVFGGRAGPTDLPVLPPQ